MAIKTMSHNSGGSAWSEGWHQLTIESAEYGDWNGKRFLDIWFKDYPKTFKLRVYEAHNKETHEEFALAKFFKLANAGIIDMVKSPDGKEAIQYDDDEKGLIGKDINGYFYKEGEYMRVSDRIAPVAQQGAILSYSNDDVNFWKGVTEKHVSKRAENNTPMTDTKTEGSEANIPF